MDEIDIAIIGSGFAGLGMAIKLRAAGIHDFLIMDKADRHGQGRSDRRHVAGQQLSRLRMRRAIARLFVFVRAQPALDAHVRTTGRTLPGFPNLFMIVGPNTGLGHHSMVYERGSHARAGHRNRRDSPHHRGSMSRPARATPHERTNAKMKSFEDKVAAITGAGSGIGRALALALAREGCHLALADRQPATLEDTVSLVRALAPQLHITRSVLDVADRQAVQAWAATTFEAHGRINLLFNNAGVALSSTIEGMDYTDLQWIVGVNFWGVVHGTQAFLPYLKASGDGHIVNVSSVFGLFAQPGMSAYNATKYAVRGFTESLRQELDLMHCGVSATCVHPGGVRTDIAQASRIAPNMFGFLIDDAQQARRDFERFLSTSPDNAARAILNGVRRNARRVLIGRDARALDRLVRLMPTAYQALVVCAMRRLARGRATTLRTQRTGEAVRAIHGEEQ